MKRNFPEEEICKSYINGERLDDLRARFKTSQEVIRKILTDNNIAIKKKGKRMPHLINGVEIGENNKICPKCKSVKEKSNFNKCSQRSDGLQTFCIDCRRIMVREGKKKRYASDSKYREYIKAYAKKIRNKYRERNREKNNEYGRLRYSKKLKTDVEARARWRIKNKNKIKISARDRKRNRIKNDMSYRLLCNLRCRIHNAFNASAPDSKSRRTKDFLGCSFEHFMKYLESKFLPGMTWKNYGLNGWHIDHIVPCTAFDLLKKEEQDKCFHYTNLQPLWATTEIARANGDMVSIGNINKNNKLL